VIYLFRVLQEEFSQPFVTKT